MTWATKEQLDFLNTKLPAFRQHQVRRTTQAFWDPLYKDWFAQWPLTHDETAENILYTKVSRVIHLTW